MENKDHYAKKLIVANWKMNPSSGSDARTMFSAINKVASTLQNVETVICPPLIYLESLGEMVTTRSCVLGAQDAFWEHVGAYTGQVSADMIFNAKARYVIVGHSERRAMGETDEVVNKKIKNILQFPLIPIVCVGELSRDSDDYAMVIKQQIHHACHQLSVDHIKRLVIAYEPVWAIGSGAVRPCTEQECFDVVLMIRQVLADLLSSSDLAKNIPILYGGSISAENAQSFLTSAGIDGLLVGRASLDPEQFITIIRSAEKI